MVAISTAGCRLLVLASSWVSEVTVNYSRRRQYYECLALRLFFIIGYAHGILMVKAADWYINRLISRGVGQVLELGGGHP
jgi:hypothetical protein